MSALNLHNVWNLPLQHDYMRYKEIHRVVFLGLLRK